ncbi:DUF5949 family protein [Streptomyces axinellae]|uniref:Uncharacterized protein n=1 Tax=Streptomyces axinellae TaxID=552788 RepID=A0ABP6C635_9ACTN
MTIPQTAQGGLRQQQFGTLTVIGWAGAYEDGRDMAFLLAYSLGDGPAGPQGTRAATKQVITEAGLPLGGEVVDGSARRGLPVTLLVEGGQAVLTMPKLTVQYPAPPEWITAARQRGQVYFMFATDPWPEGAPGANVVEDALREFVSEEMMASAAHCLLPVRSLAG